MRLNVKVSMEMQKCYLKRVFSFANPSNCETSSSPFVYTSKYLLCMISFELPMHTQDGISSGERGWGLGMSLARSLVLRLPD